MNQKIKESLDTALEVLEELKKVKSLTKSELTLEKNILYFFRREGVKVSGGRKLGRPISAFAKEFTQKGRESSIFRGTLKEALEQREKALNNPEQLKQDLEEAQAETEALEEAAEEDSQVLATSEEAPKKKRRGRKPKAKPEGEAED